MRYDSSDSEEEPRCNSKRAAPDSGSSSASSVSPPPISRSRRPRLESFDDEEDEVLEEDDGSNPVDAVDDGEWDEEFADDPAVRAAGLDTNSGRQRALRSDKLADSELESGVGVWEPKAAMSSIALKKKAERAKKRREDALRQEAETRHETIQQLLNPAEKKTSKESVKRFHTIEGPHVRTVWTANGLSINFTANALPLLNLRAK